MSKVKISSDSTCDLPPELIAKHGIGITPLYINLDGEFHRDGIDVQPEMLFKLFDEKQILPKTAAVSVLDYVDFFKKQREDGSELIHINISSDFSSCYQNACLAAEEVGGVYVVDSRNLSSGTGLLVLRAVDMRDEGMSAKDIKTELDSEVDLVDASFVICKLIYLYKGGRCSAVSAVMGNALGIKPNVNVKNGLMGVGKKYRGPYAKCLEKYVHDKLEPQIDDIDPTRIFITRSSIDPEADKATEDAINSIMHFDEIIYSSASCTVSGHCGPDTLGILFMRKKK